VTASRRALPREALRRKVLALAALAGVALWPSAPPPAAAQTPCGALDDGPCNPTVCGVFDPQPCVPETRYPIGQDLRLTIDTRSPPPERPQGDLDSIAALFRSLRACFVPPDAAKAGPGTEVSLRLSFKRNGEVIAPPRWTYTTPKTPDETRQLYRDAAMAALARCTPLRLSKGMAGAIAGRPIAIRYVENRELAKEVRQ
jgi:hypothetical protein